jgi:hypothetical protein
MIQKSLLVLFIIVFTVGVAYTQNASDFKVEQLRNNTLKIVDYIGKAKDIVIPDVLYDLPVTIVGNEAFYNKGITSVTIPDSIIEIENSFWSNGAFKENNITKIVFGKKIEKIGSSAFYGNKNLRTVIIPDSVVSIGDNAFQDCGLTSVTLGSKIQSLGKGSFAFNRIESIDLPTSLKYIGSEAFRNSIFTKIIIPNGVTFIGGEALPESVTEVVIPASLIKYEENKTGFQGAFENTENLIRITLPANVDINNFFMMNWSFNPGFDNGFINFYRNQNRKAGVYVKNGPIWKIE